MKITNRLAYFFRSLLPKSGKKEGKPSTSGEEACLSPERETRRTFTHKLVSYGSLVVSLFLFPRNLFGKISHKRGKETNGSTSPKWGMAIDLDLCTGCGACVVACKTENNVPFFGPGEQSKGTGIYWMDLLPAQSPNDEDGIRGETLPMPCMHCENPPCIKVCPVGATYQTEDGITAQISDRCIGCRYCEAACPYSRRYFNWTQPKWPESYRNFINPDVATRPKGVVEKCTFCHHRIQKAKEEARLEEAPLNDEKLRNLTACAEACPADAIVFGNLNDPNSRVSLLSHDPRTFRLLDHLGTHPKVFYLGRNRRKGSL